MGESDLYFGYGISYLRQVSHGGGYVPYVPSAVVHYTTQWERQQEAETGEKPESGPPPETPDPNSDAADGITIDQIKTQIMGEQPGTTSERAGVWSNIAMMLFNVKNELYNQTNDLEAKWESPEAKDAFLRKVGETLAYAQVWREAAEDNAEALYNLSAEMSIAQSKMRDLWKEYQQELYDAAEAHLAASPMKGLKGDTRETMIRYNMTLDNLTEVGRTKDEYNQKARELASETANAYAPIIQKLQMGRAKMLDPLDAVLHPGAYGGPIPPSAPPAGPGAPGAPGPFSANTPTFDGNTPAVPGGGGPAPMGGPTAPPVPNTPTAPTPPAATDVPTAPAAPGAAPPVPPGGPVGPVAPLLPPGLRRPPGVPPGVGPRGPGIGPGTPPPSPALPGGGAAKLPVTPMGGPGSTPAVPGAPDATVGYPPGTIAPPPMTAPPGKPPQQRQQGRVLGAPTTGPGAPGSPALGGLGSAPPPVPPPAGMPNNQNKDPAKPALPGIWRPETPEAFRVPPPATPSVLDNSARTRRRGKPAGTGAASAPENSVTPGAVPPLLANPRVLGKPESVRRADPARRRRDAGRKPSEFETGVPTGAAPVFEGRVGPVRIETAQAAGDVPVELRGPSPSAAAEHDRHARPEVQADRTVRALRQDDGTGQTEAGATWDVRTPGGPVVASTTSESKYRAEPVPAIDGKR